jgi:hypothetical protein
MKERLVRGTNLRTVVQTLRAHQKLHPLPDLGSWEQDLLRKRVSPTTWYSLSVFESLLTVVHRYVFDGSEASAQAMGQTFANIMMAAEPTTFAEDSPAHALDALHARWRAHFNFGDIRVERVVPTDGRAGARVRLTGYPDMSATHGHTLVGWAVAVAAHAGAKDVEARIEERPWMHNSVLTFVVTWRE